MKAEQEICRLVSLFFITQFPLENIYMYMYIFIIVHYIHGVKLLISHRLSKTHRRLSLDRRCAVAQ